MSFSKNAKYYEWDKNCQLFYNSAKYGYFRRMFTHGRHYIIRNSFLLLLLVKMTILPFDQI